MKNYTKSALSLLLLLFVTQLQAQTMCVDQENGRYYCNQLIVKYIPNVSESDKKIARNAAGAKVINSCECKDIELWEFKDGVNIEERGVVATKRPTIEEVGKNYRIQANKNQIQEYRPKLRQPYSGKPPSKDDVVVALIDTGIDYFHPKLNGKVWVNPAEIRNKKDDDGNCYKDDSQGWNFVTNHWQNMDNNGHGTHIAGIITKDIKAVKIMNLKVLEKDGSGDLFNSICAVYYAVSKKANLINLSFGYGGLSSPPFRSAIHHAGSNGIMVLTSAGNEGRSNNIHPHWPSGYNLPNMVNVAALNANQTNLASFSNHGHRSIHLAALGTNILSLAPGKNHLVSKDGTSMSTGAVTHTAVLVLQVDLRMSIGTIKTCILNSVSTITAPQIFRKLSTRGKLDEISAVDYIP